MYQLTTMICAQQMILKLRPVFFRNDMQDRSTEIVN